jgi:shikimate kinase
VRGVGEARAAVSIVNALPLGVGAAVGIAWTARATARLHPRPSRSVPAWIAPAASATPVVRAAARSAYARFGDGRPLELTLNVRSSIPVARGLKSSSAVASAVALATARALGTEPTAVETARIAAEAGRRSGVSATGAFDDALAGLVPGGVVTDNRADTELRRFAVEPGLRVALWIPARTHPPSPSVRGRFRRHGRLAHEAADAALAGDWRRAMAANTALVERAMGYRYAPLHAAVEAAGAVAAGVSGLGPTFVALAPTERMRAVLGALPSRAGRRRAVPLALGPLARRGRTP